MGSKLSLAAGCALLAAWVWLILVQHLPSGWPHALYAIGVMLVIRGVALRGHDTERPNA